MVGHHRMYAPRKRRRSPSSPTSASSGTAAHQTRGYTLFSAEPARSEYGDGSGKASQQPSQQPSQQEFAGQLQRAAKYGHTVGAIAPYSSVPLAASTPANTPSAVTSPRRKKRRRTEQHDGMVHPLEQPMTIQSKLTVGAVNDPHEQEADQVAAQVVASINQPTGKPSVQRDSESSSHASDMRLKPGLQPPSSDGGTVSHPIESDIQQARGRGQSLEPDTRHKMGQAMGADFKDVRIHTDNQSHRLSRQLQAKAFTTGNDVFFGKGEYNPSTKDGQELIAHELTHVVQQTGGDRDPVQRVPDEEVPFVRNAILNQWDSVQQDFPDLRLMGRQAEVVTEKLNSKRGDEVYGAIKDLGKTWAKAGAFAALDLLVPGLGTGLGYADSAYGMGKAVYDKSKVKGGGKESAKQGVEQGLGIGLEKGVESLHWSVGAGIGSIRSVGKIGKAIGQGKKERKRGKMNRFQEFAQQNKGTQASQIDAFDDCIGKVQDIQERIRVGNEENPGSSISSADKMMAGILAQIPKLLDQLEKGKARIEIMYETMRTYEEKNSEYASLLGGVDSMGDSSLDFSEIDE